MIDYQQALSVAKNYANNLPEPSSIARAHIRGLCQVLDQVGRERDALAAHVAACHALMEEMPHRSLAWQVNAMVDLKAEAPEAHPKAEGGEHE